MLIRALASAVPEMSRLVLLAALTTLPMPTALIVGALGLIVSTVMLLRVATEEPAVTDVPVKLMAPLPLMKPPLVVLLTQKPVAVVPSRAVELP